jgi:transketolase
MGPLLERHHESLLCCVDPQCRRCDGDDGVGVLEACFWDALRMVRRVVEEADDLRREICGRLLQSRERLDAASRGPRDEAPRVETLAAVAESTDGPPAGLEPVPGSQTTLRAELGRVLNHYNSASGGALLVAAADLLSSTSIDVTASGFPTGYFNAATNPRSRLLSIGGICEDAISGMLAGVSSFGRHVGVASSYGAFLAAMGHVPARMHAIGAQARPAGAVGPDPQPMILVCAHAGLETGEDGPSHADPQPLQLMQENFPSGTAITLTPWEPQEIWSLVAAALRRRPALIVPFVTRPAATVPDREALGLAPARHAAKGLYRLRTARGAGDGTLVLQGSGVTAAFVEEVLPRLDAEGLRFNVYYVTSAELFDALPQRERERIFPEARARAAMGITGFTAATLYRWVRSERGRAMSLHPFRHGRFLGSGPARQVFAEAGLDGESQYRAILRYVRSSRRPTRRSSVRVGAAPGAAGPREPRPV